MVYPVKAKAQVVEEEITYEPVLALEENKAVADELYKGWLIEQSKPIKPRVVAKTGSKVPSTSYCSCVLFAKSLTGYSKLVGNARNWPRNTKVPIVGGVVVTNESRAGHVAVITAVHSDSIEVVEANYSRCRKSSRTISLNSSVILGYWR